MDKRALFTIGNKKCPYQCIYCFVDNQNYTGIQRIDVEDFEKKFDLTSPELKTIQPTADVEFFKIKNSIEWLQKLATYGKNISFSTKSVVTKEQVIELSKINESLNAKGAILQIAVSILLLDNWRDIEKLTPSPYARIESLRLLHQYGIKTSVAFRPMMPFVSKPEIDEILYLTNKYTKAYLTGPLYLTKDIKDYMVNNGVKYLPTIKRVTWLPDNVQMEVVEAQENVDYLKAKAKDLYGLETFDNNIDLVDYLSSL